MSRKCPIPRPAKQVTAWACVSSEGRITRVDVGLGKRFAARMAWPGERLVRVLVKSLKKQPKES